MSVEKTLKKQARDILAKNNWPKSILGFLCVCLVLGLIFSVVDLASAFITEDVLGDPVNIAIIAGVSLVGGIMFILLAPVYTGYMRFIANSKNNETGDVQDIFYYFKKGKYADTVQLNLCLFIRYAMLFIVLALPVAACLFFMKKLPDFELLFKISAVWLGIIAAVAYIAVSRFWVMTQYLYVADFDYRKESELLKASRYMVKKNFGKIVSLYFSFILYALLSFFVIPIIFVYPYFKHTTFLSYSYIYELEAANPQSPYFKQAESALPVADEAEEAENSDATDEVVTEKDSTEGIAGESTDKAVDFAETSNDKTDENTAEFDNN